MILHATAVLFLLAQQPVTGQPPAPQRGGGRGRGGIQTMALTTTAWTDGARIPDKYAQPGHDVSPPLAWSWATPNVSDTIARFALIVHDLYTDAGSGTHELLHVLVWHQLGIAWCLTAQATHDGI